MNTKQITITVSGGDPATKSLMASEVQAALRQRHFTNVQVDMADANRYGQHTVLDSVRSLHPEFFNTPVRIVSVTHESQHSAPFNFCEDTSISMLPYDMTV